MNIQCVTTILGHFNPSAICAFLIKTIIIYFIMNVTLLVIYVANQIYTDNIDSLMYGAILSMV